MNPVKSSLEGCRIEGLNSPYNVTEGDLEETTIQMRRVEDTIKPD